MERNRELFEKIAAQIEETPDRWNQSHWATDSECGTVMCVAGWAAELTCGLIEIESPWGNDKTMLAPAARDERHAALGFDTYGREVLGLTADEADEMFYGSWDEMEEMDVHEAAEFLRAFGRGEAHFGREGAVVWDKP